MLTKEQVLAAVETMPDTFDATELFDRMLLLNKIEEGRKDIKEGNVFTTEEAKAKLSQWLK